MADDSTTRCLLFQGFERRPVVDDQGASPRPGARSHQLPPLSGQPASGLADRWGLRLDAGAPPPGRRHEPGPQPGLDPSTPPAQGRRHGRACRRSRHRGDPSTGPLSILPNCASSHELSGLVSRAGLEVGRVAVHEAGADPLSFLRRPALHWASGATRAKRPVAHSALVVGAELEHKIAAAAGVQGRQHIRRAMA